MLPLILDMTDFLAPRLQEEIAHLRLSLGITDDDEIPRLHVAN